MAHFAEINASNIVLRVIVVPDSEETNGAAWCANLLGGMWVQTSYNATIRKNFAGIGFTFDSMRNAFIPPKPYPSWVLNEITCQWNPPVSKPPTGEWDWNEETEQWVEN